MTRPGGEFGKAHGLQLAADRCLVERDAERLVD